MLKESLKLQQNMSEYQRVKWTILFDLKWLLDFLELPEHWKVIYLHSFN